MQLKNSYSAREVAALTGLSARQLQWWDERRLFLSAVAPKPTAAGGFTERRYTPVDLLELMVLADLRRQGMTVVAHPPAARDAPIAVRDQALRRHRRRRMRSRC